MTSPKCEAQQLQLFPGQKPAETPTHHLIGQYEEAPLLKERSHLGHQQSDGTTDLLHALQELLAILCHLGPRI